MSSARLVISALLLLGGVLVGCTSSPDDGELGTSADELQLSDTQYLGTIRSGETKSTRFTPPTHLAYGFNAKGGDEITATVAAVSGDGIGYITDERFNVLAVNDNGAPGSLDAKVKYLVPSGTPSTPYRVVFRDNNQRDTTIKVTFSLRSLPPVCTYNGTGYQAGDRFDSIDGCNTCTCNANGSITCSKLTCECNPAAEPWRHYLGTPAQCVSLSYTCPTGWRPFANTCGCGCEQINH